MTEFLSSTFIPRFYYIRVTSNDRKWVVFYKIIFHKKLTSIQNSFTKGKKQQNKSSQKARIPSHEEIKKINSALVLNFSIIVIIKFFHFFKANLALHLYVKEG